MNFQSDKFTAYPLRLNGMAMRVFFLFDSQLLAEGLKNLLLLVHDQAEPEWLQPGHDIQQQLQNHPWSILLLDADMQGIDQLALLTWVKENDFPGKIIFVYEKIDRKLLEAYRRGLNGSFSKTDSKETITQAIASIVQGDVYVPQSIIMNILYDGFIITDLDARINQLSERERSVLRNISNGQRNKEAAKRLGLAPSTLSAHKQRIMKKMGIATRQEFANFLKAFERSHHSEN